VHQIAAGFDVFRPRQDAMAEASLKALQSASLGQFIAEPAKAISGLVVAEMRTSDHSKPNVGATRSVAVATLEAEINGAACNQRIEIHVRE
jgi:hypothetical protein